MRLLTVLFAQGALATSLDQTWDYIIVGSGVSGIPLADRLSETGKSVLLLERGFASSGRWGGTWKPSWLQGTNLTRFDVPALAQLVWQPEADNRRIFCDDVPSPAGCLLGGGTAINAGQFYLPTPDDLDLNQPRGWRWIDIQGALAKVKKRLPWTDTPSVDGKSYMTNSTKIIKDALTNKTNPGRFRFITANEDVRDRHRVSSDTEFFFLNGEKGGPMATYLVTASKRKNFRMQLYTTVTRVLRDGNIALGVEVQASGSDGVSGTFKVTPKTGRVILSAGVFGSFKILLRSGIGPGDILRTLSNNTSESTKLPPRIQWIDLPVGENLDDGSNFNMGVVLPSIESYPWVELWNSTADNPDIKTYLTSRSGPLAQLQPSIGPVSWDTVLGEDGRKRVVQWDASSAPLPGGGGYIVFTSNLNLGHTSRGRLSLSPDLKVTIAKTPYYNDPGDHDFKAIVQSAATIRAIMQTIPGITASLPLPGQSLEEFLHAQTPISNNHWAGSAKMGEKCGDNGAVVDARTIVCGMRNLHVVDASILNGIPTANPQGTFIVVAERAAEVIRALP